MLIERTFAVGGWLCVAAAALYVVAIVGAGAFDAVLLVTPVLFSVMGAMFLYASAQARADRRRLLALGADRTPSETPPPPG